MMQLKRNVQIQPKKEKAFSSLEITYEEKHALAWYRMNAKPRPCFTSDLIQEIQAGFLTIKDTNPDNVEYVVMASSTPNTFNLGGDLDLFKRLIVEKNYDELFDYAMTSIKPLYLFHIGLDSDITTISLVQGDALGAGFEAAISGDILIAEKGAKMGLPEVLFNMFPGMGAYSFISRKVSTALADKMILGGKLYTASELYEMGIVDILVEDGEGEQAVYDYIRKENRSRNTYKAIRRAKRCFNPVTFEELERIASIWVDANMKLRDKDIRMMERLVKRQSAKVNQ